MKSFVLAMVLGVSLSTVAAVALARAVLPPLVWEAPPPAEPAGASQPFTEREAVQVVANRLGSSRAAWELRRTLVARATVAYHSPNHWTVRLDDANWTAHGSGGPGSSGRYAQPDNEAAHQFEARAQP